MVFLGFVIPREGLEMDLEKVNIIMEWPSPRNADEVMSFHELVSFYKKFINNLIIICAPIVDTIKSEHHPFDWIEAIQRVFRLLKKKMTEKHILVLPYFHKLFEAKCDASGMGIRVFLSQEERLISYLSEKIKDYR